MKTKMERTVDQLREDVLKRWKEFSKFLDPEQKEFNSDKIEELLTDLTGLAETISWTPVKSSNLRAVRYHDSVMQLDVMFNGGDAVYEYTDVPIGVYKVLIDGSLKSVGRYFNKSVKPFYKCVKRVKD